MSSVDDRPLVIHDDDPHEGGGPREQLPPQDLAAERSVLGAMLLSKDAIADVVEVMKPDFFYRPAHQTIYQAVLELYGRGEPADFITVADELTKNGQLERVGGAAYVTGLTRDLPSAVNATYHAEIVRQRALLRKVIEAGTRVIQAAYDGAGEADDIVNRAQAEMYEISAGRRSEDYVPLADILEGAIAEIEAIANHDGDMVGVPTGLRDLDTLTQGLHPGQLVIIAARPAIGKALALDTEIATPSGWTTMGEITPGDELFAPDGSVTRVVAATDVMAGRPCYRVHFSDGSAIVADEEHLWSTESRAERRARHAARLPRQRRTRMSGEQVQRWAGLGAQLHESLTMSAPELADLSGLRPSSSALRRTLLEVGAAGSRRERRRIGTKGYAPADVARAFAKVGGPSVGEAALLGDVLRAEDVAVLLGTSAEKAKRRLRRRSTPAITTDEVAETTGRQLSVYPARDVMVALAKDGARLLNDQRGSAFSSIRTTGDLASSVMAGEHFNHSIPVTSPLDLPAAVLPISPYVLGTWLGDGNAKAARVTSGDAETWDLLEAEGLVVRHGGGAPLTRSLTYGTPNPITGARSLQADLRSMGVLGAKHIPASYLRASVAQRKALLAGLLDTDGTVTSTGSPQFTTTSARLSEDVFDLIVGLGYRCSVVRRVVAGRTPESSVSYTVNFTSHKPLFRLRRKRELQRTRRRGVRRTSTLQRRYITRVEPIESVPVRCIQVDRADGMFLAGRSMIPTHNSTLGLDIARSASIKHGLASVIFSLEMSRNEIMMRLLSAEGTIQLNNIRSGRMGARDWQNVAHRQDALREAPLFIDDSPNMTMTEIRAKCRRLKQQHDLRLVVVDYMQLMSSGKRVESRQQEVSEFSRALKLLAKELEVPVIAMSQLNRGPEQRTDKKPMLADLRESGCLTADTRVVRADTGAEVTMGELYRTGERNIPVWSLDESLRYRARTMTHVFPTGHREIFEVRLRSGRTVQATENHPLLTYHGFRAVGDLAPGSRVAVPRHVPPPMDIKPMDANELVLLAHLLGDGSFVKRQPIRYASVSPENLDAVAEAAHRRFGIEPVRDEYPQARVTTLRLPAPFRLARGRRNPIAAWLDQWGLFGRRSHEKFVPGPVFSAPKEQVATFLRHLWATDGCIQRTGSGGGQVYYATTSRRLADDVARLLLRFGLIARITEANKPGYRPSFHVSVSGAADQKVFLRRIGGFGPKESEATQLLVALQEVRANTNVDTVPRDVWEDVRRLIAESDLTHREFQAALGTQYSGSALFKRAPSRERLAAVAEVLDSADLELMATNDVFWDEIVAVRSLGRQDVFDATVVGTHNFIADGVVVHNSLEQDADVVLLIHREDFYDKENRPGEADLIVAKHRNGPTDTIAASFQGHYSRFVDLAG